jgi:ubiquinone/menaquinone biosynthesis C-methylase UbiE
MMLKLKATGNAMAHSSTGAGMADDNPYEYSLTTRFKDRHIMRMLSPESADAILDVGCGLGYFMNLLAERGNTATGIDYSVDSLLSCRARLPGHYVRADAVRLPFAANVFNKVLFTDVIEHLEDDAGALREISRVAGDGATVVITTQAQEGLLTGSKLNRLYHDDSDSLEYHVRDGYTARSLAELLDRYAIQVTEVRYTTVLITEIMVELSKLAYLLTRGSGGAFDSQADLLAVNESLPFKLYKALFFPLALAIGYVEEKLLAGLLKGHILIVKARVSK